MLIFQEDFKRIGKTVHIDFLHPLDQGLIALQGPTAATVLQSLVKIDLQTLKFMNSIKTEMLGSQIRISRCGYTGEDGFEISMLAKDATNLVEMILDVPDVKLAGLGARDSLRYAYKKSKQIFYYIKLCTRIHLSVLD